jgi:hypothetical protein
MSEQSASFLSTMAPETQALARGFADFLAERAGARRTDSAAFLEKPLSPMEQIFGTGIRYDSKLLHQDAMAFVGRALPSLRNDAAFTSMFARQLEYIYTWTADVEYPDLKARSLIPVDTEVPTGADYYTYRMYDVAAKASMLHNYAKNSFPESDVYGDEFKQAIKGMGSKYSYSVQDMRAAAMSGVPLEAKKASSARYGIEKRLEQIGAFGDVGTGLYGITNAPGVAGVTKISPAGTWAQQITAAVGACTLSATTQAILQDINAQANAIFSNTLGIHKPTTLILPTPAYAVLATTPWSPVYRDESILQFILKSSPWLEEIVDWPYLNTLGNYALLGTVTVTNGSPTATFTLSQTGYVVVGDLLTFSDQPGVQYKVLTVSTVTVTLTTNYTGTGGAAKTATKQSGLSVLYEKNPRVLNLVISQEFEQFPPEQDGLLWEIYCHLRTGGVNVIRPLAVVTQSGIS